MWNHYGPGLFMYFGPVFFVAVIFACSVMLMFLMRGHHGGRGGAHDILRERLARGEIDKTEYEERRRLLDA